MPSHSIFLIPGETVHHAPNADLSCPVPWYRPAQSKDSSYGMHTVEFLTSEEGICAANPKYTLPAASPLRISPNHPRGYVQPNLNTCSLRHLHCAYPIRAEEFIQESSLSAETEIIPAMPGQSVIVSTV